MSEPKPNGLPDERLFEARLAEYVSARDEMISAITNQHYALTFGTASIVAVLVAGFLRWEHHADPLIFFAVAPVSAWVLAVWLGEVVRMLRSVQFCREQEVLVGAMFDPVDPENPPLRWESWRHEKGTTITWSYVSIVAVLSGAYLTGVVLGLVVANWSSCATALVAAAFAGFLIAILWFVLGLFVEWGSDEARAGAPPVVAKWARRLRR
jgi:hypothetical protein